MISPNDVTTGMIAEITTVYYSYEKGIAVGTGIITVAFILALLSMGVSFIMRLKRKDCIAVFWTNIMTKSIAGIIFTVLFFRSYINLLTISNRESILLIAILILLFISCVVGEKKLYDKILENKKKKSIIISLVCNICAMGLIILCYVLMGM